MVEERERVPSDSLSETSVMLGAGECGEDSYK